MKIKYFLSLLVSTVLVYTFTSNLHANEVVNTGLFTLRLEPINACYFIKEENERITCFGKAVESSWKEVQEVKSQQAKLINTGKAILINPITYNAEDESMRLAVLAYIRKVLCGGPDCTREQFKEFNNEITAFGKLAKTEDYQGIDNVIKKLAKKGMTDPKYSEILSAFQKNTPIDKVPDDIVKQIKSDIAKDHPDDYSVQALLIKQEKKAYITLANTQESKGVPQDVFNKIKSKLAKDHAGDYSVQLLLLKQEIKAYLELHN